MTTSEALVLPRSCFNPHTHTGCDLQSNVAKCKALGFNPHTHTGCDVIPEMDSIGMQQFQSTHPYRVWLAELRSDGDDHQFQSTHPYRVWLLLCLSCPCPFLFQSTHPYRVWLDGHHITLLLERFNPHTHTGCDKSASSNQVKKKVSIHTPIQGVTQVTSPSLQVSLLFQSTHPYRVWLMSRSEWFASNVFQSTHPYRVWRSLVICLPFISEFQSTHPYRVWRLRGSISSQV